MSTQIVVGHEREERLLSFGLPQGLLEALGQEVYDPITALVACNDGTELAEIAALVGVAGALPPGRVVPICQIDDSGLFYYLVVEADLSLVWWSAEATEPVDGGVMGFLTDLVIEAWETGDVGRDELVHWAERIGLAAGRRLVEALTSADLRTHEAHERFRGAFLRTLA